MELHMKRNGGDIEFRAWIIGSGATVSSFILYADDDSTVSGTEDQNGYWHFDVKKADVGQENPTWPDEGYLVLKVTEPVWQSGSPTIHFSGTQDRQTLPNKDPVGGDTTNLATASVNGMTICPTIKFIFD